MKHTGFDVIGDIHGQVDKLLGLLVRLGYRNEAGVFRHPTRQAIFLGDFIDRGPAIRDTLGIVRRMVEGEAALSVIGNHEFNALMFQRSQQTAPSSTTGVATKAPRMLSKTLAEFADHGEEWTGFLDWFSELPLYLDLGALRVVHAVWSGEAIAALGGHRTVSAALLSEAAEPTTPAGRAVRILLNGWQVPLPGTSFIEDFEGSMRNMTRLAWWKKEVSPTYRSLSFPYELSVPEVPLPAELSEQLPGYDFDAPPVFIGHYALSPDLTPWPQTANIACVDYRAARGGPLVAYCWDGEQILTAEKFVS
jgi:hypothetical protein